MDGQHGIELGKTKRSRKKVSGINDMEKANENGMDTTTKARIMDLNKEASRTEKSFTRKERQDDKAKKEVGTDMVSRNRKPQVKVCNNDSETNRDREKKSADETNERRDDVNMDKNDMDNELDITNKQTNIGMMTVDLNKIRTDQINNTHNNMRKDDKEKEEEKIEKKNELSQRIYAKEMTVILETEEIEGLNAIKLIKEIEKQLGPGKLLALRPRPNKQFEATVETTEDCETLEDGLEYEGMRVGVKRLWRNEVMVSFLHLPPYTTDGEVLSKLLAWGVEPILPLRRRYYPGTTVADGTRFIRVRFPKEVASLPYSVKFDTPDGPQYCRVIHDRQVKICRSCMSPGHVLRDCPLFTCRECLQQGHYARECAAVKCPDCRRAMIRCECLPTDEEEEEEGEVATAPEAEGDGGDPPQLHRDQGEEEISQAHRQRQRTPPEDIQRDGERGGQTDMDMDEDVGGDTEEVEDVEQQEQVGKEAQNLQMDLQTDGEKRKRGSSVETEGIGFNRRTFLKQQKGKKNSLINIQAVMQEQEKRRSMRKGKTVGLEMTSGTKE